MVSWGGGELGWCSVRWAGEAAAAVAGYNYDVWVWYHGRVFAIVGQELAWLQETKEGSED